MPAFTLPRKEKLFPSVRQDVTASLVVFLVALPLCVGVAVASGVPAELGLVTGIVGGLVAGLLPGSSLQVSGPAAGLTVLTLDLVQHHGLASLGAVVLGAGLLQILFGVLRVGRWFQAISSGVVQGMLAGIGAVLILGQLFAALDRSAPGGAWANLTGLPSLLGGGASLAAGGIAVLTLLVIAVWPRVPVVSRYVPAPLAAVLVAVLATAGLGLPITRLEVGSLADVLQPPGAAQLTGLVNGTLIGSVLVFALIASAESLFSAAAVDRMHTGPRTAYNKELVAQGVGNTVCGALGALPMTAVIVRSSANVNAGARTRLSRVLHGFWLLVFVVAVPGVLDLVPVAALAALLLQAGWKLVSPAKVALVWKENRGEAVVLLLTAAAIVATTLFEGVLIGVLAALVKTAWELSHLHVSVVTGPDGTRLRLSGHATFLRVPRLNRALDELPADGEAVIDCGGLGHYDHACQETVREWIQRQRAVGRTITLIPPAPAHP
ncbi:SulP family inorganic anion transporter [Amycolatopsis acidicola]|uniref:SulP family inorganic anion transporter n=1 Tax=Amycolatopsis acidicola TaxID=2596893 RepID=A0A5N0V2N6_9PSEU|nr:SulP family inorganic anion transporter [Amycolatopsis acidicola]KAA9158738.1 SulP family inorganic anion transporter [Amycolatopsis acidicola]